MPTIGLSHFQHYMIILTPLSCLFAIFGNVPQEDSLHFLHHSWITIDPIIDKLKYSITLQSLKDRKYEEKYNIYFYITVLVDYFTAVAVMLHAGMAF